MSAAGSRSPPPPNRPSRGAEATPEPCAIVIFGASGDLTRRMLLPALYNLSADDRIPDQCAIVGFARTEWSDDDFREHTRQAVDEFSRRPIDPAAWKKFADSLFYVSGDYSSAESHDRLKERLEELEEARGIPGNHLYHLAVPPSAYTPIIEGLSGSSHATPTRRGRTLVARNHRKAVRPRSRLLPRAQPAGPFRLQRRGRLPDRPLPRQGDRAEHPRLSLRQRHLRTGLEPALRGPRPDHRGRDDRSRAGAAATTRSPARSAIWCRITCSSSSRWSRWNRRSLFDGRWVRDEKVKVLEAIRPFTLDDVLDSTVRGQYGGGGSAAPKRCPPIVKRKA